MHTNTHAHTQTHTQTRTHKHTQTLSHTHTLGVKVALTLVSTPTTFISKRCRRRRQRQRLEFCEQAPIRRMVFL